MHVIATAGHVDHGKSTLIRALTGMEPDRWAEERRRGMTIDLGYAWTDLANGTCAFVDVPGHHRFVGNMLAGIGPVPAVLFVVAADEGWARQSAEHLSALDALDVRNGVLAITRSDLADADLAAEEARDYLTGTSLAGIESVAVSGRTGAGLDQLREALVRMTSGLPEPARGGPTRLWVDRVFTARGAGTIVTGTLSSGTIAVGDELSLAPSGRSVRVRALETLKTPADKVEAVARVAVNLRNLKSDEVRRGDAFVTPGLWAPVTMLDVRLVRAAERLPAELTLHAGSAAVPVRVRRLGPDIARLTLTTPLPLHVGERALLRDPGALHIVAGLVVLDTDPPALVRRGSAAARAEELANVGGQPDPIGEIRRRGVVARSQLVSAGVLAPDAATPPQTVGVAGWFVHQERWERWQQELTVAVEQWQADHPLDPGLPRASAIQQLRLPDPRVLEALVAQTAGLTVDANGVHQEDAAPQFPPEVEEALAGIRTRLGDEPFAAPDVPELAALGLTERHLGAAVRGGLLVGVGGGVYLLPETVTRAVRQLAELPQPFTLSQGRQALQTTRRVAVPLLEHLDREQHTRRVDATLREVRPTSSALG